MQQLLWMIPTESGEELLCAVTRTAATVRLKRCTILLTVKLLFSRDFSWGEAQSNCTSGFSRGLM